MSKINLYVNVASGQLVVAPSIPTVVNPATIPLFLGDQPTLMVQLLQPIPNQAGQSGSTLTPVPTAGLTLVMYLDNGLAGMSNVIYAQQVSFTSDSTGTFWTGIFPLNSPALLALFTGTLTSVPVWIQIGYLTGAFPTTVFSDPTSVDVGLPGTIIPVAPPGQTPISLEIARAMFFPLQPVPGQPVTLQTALGHTFIALPKDNPDGTATCDWEQIN